MSRSLKTRLVRLERKRGFRRNKPKVIIAIHPGDDDCPASGTVGLLAGDEYLQRIPSQPTIEFYRRAAARFEAAIIFADYVLE